MFKDTEIYHRNYDNNQTRFFIKGIFYSIVGIESYLCKIIIIFNTKSGAWEMEEMALMNEKSGIYESVKGMFCEDIESRIIQDAL